MSKRQRAAHPFESEIALLITGNGEKISRDFARMNSILQFTLKQKPLERIHDTYYDTADESLRKQQIVLRLRRMNQRLFITLKANPKKLKGEGIQRTEVELPWSKISLARITRMLGSSTSRISPREFSTLPPARILAGWGLRRVQERRTSRRVRDVVSKDRPQGPPLAELAIDDTTFIFRNSRIRLFELELEAKTTGSFRSMQRIAKAIVAMYPNFIMYWPYGKFVTGLAIQRLLKTRELKSYIKQNRLRKEAFPLIRREINSAKMLS